MHLVTAKSKFRVIRYGKWSPRPKRTDQGSGNFMYINGDTHSPMFETDPFLDDCWVETSGNELKFYISDYRRYIQYLSWVFLGGSPYEVHATAIGPDTATKLLKDYV